MAVADVFTALAEDRPYRAGMQRSSVMQILQNMADDRGLNGDLVSLLGRNYDEIDMARIEAQKRSSGEYRTLSHRDDQM